MNSLSNGTDYLLPIADQAKAMFKLMDAIHFEKTTFQHFPHTNVWGRKIDFKCFFTVYGHGRPSCLMAQIYLNKLSIFFRQKAPSKI